MSAFAPQPDVRDISPDDQKLKSIVAAKYASEPQMHVQCGKAERAQASKPLDSEDPGPFTRRAAARLEDGIAAEKVETEGS